MNTLTPTPYVRLRRAHARKLGPRAIGGVTYELLANPERDTLFITIVGNDGAGCWSREVVRMADIEAAISIGGRDPFPPRRLASAFVGRSVNNAGFLAAALAHEGLIQPAATVKHHLISAGDWEAWHSAALALPGEDVMVPPAAAPAASEPESSDTAEPGSCASGDGEEVPPKARRGRKREDGDARDS